MLTKDDGGAGWSDLGFTTATDGIIVHAAATTKGGDGRPGELLLSHDDGRRWHPTRF